MEGKGHLQVSHRYTGRLNIVTARRGDEARLNGIRIFFTTPIGLKHLSMAANAKGSRGSA